jgi:hypothetical protein
MGCQGSVYLGDNLTFSICTHDADTGALTDTSAAPAYRVYEDETATAILTGTMAKLDDANTLGFYTELIACTTANGFEIGKSYTIYIEATVDGITGGIAYGFTVENVAVMADAVHDEVVDGTVTFRQSTRIQNSSCAGEVSGAATTTILIRDLGDTKTRLTATVDADGNRTAVVLTDVT